MKEIGGEGPAKRWEITKSDLDFPHGKRIDAGSPYGPIGMHPEIPVFMRVVGVLQGELLQQDLLLGRRQNYLSN